MLRKKYHLVCSLFILISAYTAFSAVPVDTILCSLRGTAGYWAKAVELDSKNDLDSFLLHWDSIPLTFLRYSPISTLQLCSLFMEV